MPGGPAICRIAGRRIGDDGATPRVRLVETHYLAIAPAASRMAPSSSCCCGRHAELPGHVARPLFEYPLASPGTADRCRPADRARDTGVGIQGRCHIDHRRASKPKITRSTFDFHAESRATSPSCRSSWRRRRALLRPSGRCSAWRDAGACGVEDDPRAVDTGGGGAFAENGARARCAGMGSGGVSPRTDHS